RRNAKPCEHILGDDMFDRFQTQIIKRVGCLLDLVDFRRCEEVVRGFVPIGLAINRVKVQPLAFDRLLPIAAGLARDSLHALSSPRRGPHRCRRSRRARSPTCWMCRVRSNPTSIGKMTAMTHTAPARNN